MRLSRGRSLLPIDLLTYEKCYGGADDAELVTSDRSMHILRIFVCRGVTISSVPFAS